MQIILHTGAHFTDEDRLMKCLLRNKEDFSKIGVAVPGPGKYRKLLRKTIAALTENQPSPDARDVLLDAFLDAEQADRIILSHALFFGAPRSALRAGVLYPNAPQRMKLFSDLFPYDQIEMFMALRNPATLLPAIYQQSPRDEVEDFLDGIDPRQIRWSEIIEQIRETVPNVALTLWCYEDTPLIWSQIVRDMAGLDHGTKIQGGFDLLTEIMSREGMQRFRSYLKSHPAMTEMQKRRVIAAFLDKFALEEELEEELDLPGLTEAMVDEMTDIYDEDVFLLQRMPGVHFIAP
ncbi:MAG: hypothetical protein AAFR45_05485 [Pseudomonadota bacterium]